MKKPHAMKHEELVTEFTRYIIDTPQFLDRIPDNALVVLLDRRDPEYCRYAIRQAKSSRKNDDKPGRPIAYIDVGKLAPVKSRIIRPRVLRKAPEFAEA